jgi:hypothetical protein
VSPSAVPLETCFVKLAFGRMGDWLVDPRGLTPRHGGNTVNLKRTHRQGRLDAHVVSSNGNGIGETHVIVGLHGRGGRGVFEASETPVSEEVW